MKSSFSSLPYDILRQILLLVEDWDSLRSLALTERAVYSVYQSSRDYIDKGITERVSYSYLVPSIALQLRLTPPTLHHSTLSPDLLPVKLQFTATLSGTRPIMLHLPNSPFCDWKTGHVRRWIGTKKRGPWCSHFGENTVYMTEISPSGVKTELPIPQRPPRRRIPCGGSYGRLQQRYSDKPENFLFLEPGVPWVSQELDIPNFPCRQWYEYVAGVYEEPWGDWWCYGTKEEFLHTGEDDLLDYRMVVEARMRREMRLGEEVAIDGWFDDMEFPVVRSEGFKVL